MKKSLLAFLLAAIILLGPAAPAMASEDTGFTDVAPTHGMRKRRYTAGNMESWSV